MTSPVLDAEPSLCLSSSVVSLLTSPTQGCESSSLLPSTPVHPIFSPCNFPTLNPSAYSSLLPSLRLTSKFLTSNACLAWWVAVLLSNPITKTDDADKERTYLPSIPFTRIELELVKDRLVEHATDVTFRFRDEDVRHLGFLVSGYASADMSQKMRFGFHIATLLLHESAHSVYGLRYPATLLGEESEPFHSLADTEVAEELGSSLEAFLFGGKIQPVNLDPSCEEGLVWFPWVPAEEKLDNFWGVRMTWIESLFDQGWWRRVEALEREDCGVELVGKVATVPFSE
ncbi:hypothetical protein MMC08_007276, partial [Hypocenomyce scalaris]|nr:hypothetical protein [Hypocenomyce scalaris]